jgi:hypothetical protein
MILVMVKSCVFFAVRTEFLNIKMKFDFVRFNSLLLSVLNCHLAFALRCSDVSN